MLKMRPGEIGNTKCETLNPEQYQMIKIPMSQRSEFEKLESRICLGLRD